MIYRISRPARGDLRAIWRYSATTWGPEQADAYVDAMVSRFAWLATNRTLWRGRNDLEAGLYSYPQDRHVIIFRERNDGLDIVRVLHGRMDVEKHV